MAGSHRVLVTRAVGLVELSAVLSLRTSGHHRPDAGTDGEQDGRTVRTPRAPFDVAGQEWFANWDGGEVMVDVTAGTRRPAPPPPSCTPPKLALATLRPFCSWVDLVSCMDLVSIICTGTARLHATGRWSDKFTILSQAVYSEMSLTKREPTNI